MPNSNASLWSIPLNASSQSSIYFFVLSCLVGRLSEDCEYFAYGLSSSGSDWVTVRFIKADDLTELPDVLERVKFSCLAWTHDAKGIFYNSYPKQEGKTDGQKLLTHYK